jgi:hypothetical protein
LRHNSCCADVFIKITPVKARAFFLVKEKIPKASFGWGVLVGITQRVLGEKPGLHGGWQYFLNAGHGGCI